MFVWVFFGWDRDSRSAGFVFVMAWINRLIVPSSESLATFGAKHLDILTHLLESLSVVREPRFVTTPAFAKKYPSGTGATRRCDIECKRNDPRKAWNLRGKLCVSSEPNHPHRRHGPDRAVLIIGDAGDRKPRQQRAYRSVRSAPGLRGAGTVDGGALHVEHRGRPGQTETIIMLLLVPAATATSSASVGSLRSTGAAFGTRKSTCTPGRWVHTATTSLLRGSAVSPSLLSHITGATGRITNLPGANGRRCAELQPAA